MNKIVSFDMNVLKYLCFTSKDVLLCNELVFLEWTYALFRNHNIFDPFKYPHSSSDQFLISHLAVSEAISSRKHTQQKQHHFIISTRGVFFINSRLYWSERRTLPDSPSRCLTRVNGSTPLRGDLDAPLGLLIIASRHDSILQGG